MRAGLDAGAKVPELAVNPAAFDHVFDLEAALLVEGHVTQAPGLGLPQIGAAGKAAVGGGLTRRLVTIGPLTRSGMLIEQHDDLRRAS